MKNTDKYSLEIDTNEDGLICTGDLQDVMDDLIREIKEGDVEEGERMIIRDLETREIIYTYDAENTTTREASI